jgi:hypothetical protein
MKITFNCKLMRRNKGILLKKTNRSKRILSRIKLRVRRSLNGTNLHKRISRAISKGSKIRTSFLILTKRIRRNTNP